MLLVLEAVRPRCQLGPSPSFYVVPRTLKKKSCTFFYFFTSSGRGVPVGVSGGSGQAKAKKRRRKSKKIPHYLLIVPESAELRTNHRVAIVAGLWQQAPPHQLSPKPHCKYLQTEVALAAFVPGASEAWTSLCGGSCLPQSRGCTATASGLCGH